LYLKNSGVLTVEKSVGYQIWIAKDLIEADSEFSSVKKYLSFRYKKLCFAQEFLYRDIVKGHRRTP